MRSTQSRLSPRLGALVVTVVLALCAASPVRAASPHITDAVDDAYRLPDTPAGQPEPRPPMPLLSNDIADIVAGSLSPTSPTQRGHDGAYQLSLTVAGAPQPKYNYIVGADFGADCRVIHFLTPGQTRRAIATCGQGDKTRSIGHLSGSLVTAKGNTVSATFSFRKFLLPGRLKVDRTLGPFWVLTCPSRGTDKWACEYEDLLDFAYSENSYDI